jgi:hypothetical protein
MREDILKPGLRAMANRIRDKKTRSDLCKSLILLYLLDQDLPDIR